MAVTDFRGVHSGERVFLVGNGPSISRTPLDLLEDEYSIAMNKIDLVYDETSWRPTYYLSVEASRRKEDAKHSVVNAKKGLTAFISDDKKEFYPDLDTIHYINRKTIEPDDYPKTAREADDISHIWSDDVGDVVYRIQSSMYTAVQLAAFMGFDEMYLIGCDLYPVFQPFPYRIFKSGNNPLDYVTGTKDLENYKNFVLDNGRPFRSLVNGLSYKLLRNDRLMDRLYWLYYRLGLVENTHFTDEYNPSMYYQVGDNANLIRMHEAIRAISDRKGFDVYNATYGGHLEVYERVDMEAVVSGGDSRDGEGVPAEAGRRSDRTLGRSTDG